MKKTLLFLLLISTSLGAKVYNVASPGAGKDIQPIVQSTIDLSANGDTINLPEGIFVTNQKITCSKGLTINGAGRDKTVIGSGTIILDVIFLFTKANNVVFKNLALVGRRDTTTRDVGLRFNNCLDFVVMYNKFEHFGSSAVWVVHNDSIARGLISRNIFNDNERGYEGLGLGYAVSVYGENKKWIDKIIWGTDNFIYIENNIMNKHRHSIAAGGCGLYVSRYNYILTNTISHAIDMHEARQNNGSNHYATRAADVYGNILINTTDKNGKDIEAGSSPRYLAEAGITCRGGEMLVHDNYISGYRFGVGITNGLVWQHQDSAYAYPIFCQQGYLSGKNYGPLHTGTKMPKGDGDVFVWNNIFLNNCSLDKVSCSDFYNYLPKFLKEGRDYHLVKKPSYKSYKYPHPKTILK